MSLEVAIEKQVQGVPAGRGIHGGRRAARLAGPSGSGKTMTLRAIAGLETPDRGRIVLHGRVLFDSEKGSMCRRGRAALACCFKISRCFRI